MSGSVILHTPEPSSGAAHYVAELAKSLAAADQPVVLFCPTNFAYKQELVQLGIAVVSSGWRGTACGAGFGARVARNLRFLTKACVSQLQLTRRGDIVHFQFPLYFLAGLFLLLLAKLQARGVVYTAHDPVPHKWLLPRPFRTLERLSLVWMYRLSDRIIVHNVFGKQLLVDTFSLNPGRIAVIPHGTLPLQNAGIPNKNQEGLRLLIFGSIREDKGLDLAIEAVQRINSGNVRVRLHIAGTVANAREQIYWNRCRRLIELSTGGISISECFVPDGELFNLFSRCDAVLLPYKDAASESGVASVALTVGRPIIATCTGSFAGLFDAADLGIPISSASVPAVEQAIRLALQIGYEGLQQKGIRGLEFMRSTRSWKSVARQTSDLYAQMLHHDNFES